MKSEPEPHKKPGRKPLRKISPALLGCGLGGCLIPTLLFLFSALVMRDTGGPLFWPILSLFLGISGLMIGVAAQSTGKDE